MKTPFTIKPSTWLIMLVASAAVEAAIIVGLYYLIREVF